MGLFELLLLLLGFSLLDVELVLEAGDDKFWETVEAPAFPGEVLTDKGDVNPELFDVIVELLLLVACVLRGGEFLELGGPFVLKSCGEDTLEVAVVSAYLQLAEGFRTAGLGVPEFEW